MSTHFRPRPSPAPPSPVRPSTAHSTIRTVPPSPPDSRDEDRKPLAAFQLQFLNQRPSSPPEDEQDLRDEQAASLTAEEHEIEIVRPKSANQDDTERPASPLKRGGVNSGRSSPTKARSRSPQKKPTAPPTQAPSSAPEPAATSTRDLVPETSALLQHDSEDWDDLAGPPYTPSPRPRHQRKRPYHPISHSSQTSTHHITAPSHPPYQLQSAHQDPSPIRQPIVRKPLLTHTQSHPASPPRPAPQRSTSGRVSNSGSAVSRHSVFSTPGRDELERKKALVEADEGPFARVTSMSDLDEERRRLGGEKRIEVDKEKGDRRKTGLGGVGKVCKAGCMVM